MPSKPPSTHKQFVRRFPKLGEAWNLAQDAAASGPIPEKTQRLVKLGIALGTMREGAVHSAVRRARDSGVTAEEIEQVVALAASNVGLPSAVAVWTWVRDELDSRTHKAPSKR